MSEGAWFITAEQLAACGSGGLPQELTASSNLVYSSPATLAYNSPGAQGVGVKRAGLSVPESIMLLVAPACCGRNTTALGRDRRLSDRCYYLLLDDTDIVTGRHLRTVPEAVKEIVAIRPVRPKAVMLCVTCVDALLGTDMKRMCRVCSDAAGVPVAACTMYALTREGALPPMVSVRQAIYSLLETRPRHADACNILGYFSPLQEGCDLHDALHQAGIRHVRELSTCRSYDEFQSMSEANFNLVLHPEARLAAVDLERRLGIPFIELPRLYQPDKVGNLYRILGQELGTIMAVEPSHEAAVRSIQRLRERHGDAVFSVGEWMNADPFEMSLSLIRNGFRVSEIFGTIGRENFVFLKKLAERSPQTRVYSNLSPTMLYYEETHDADMAIGRDAAYYHPTLPHVPWADDAQPFGFTAIERLYAALDRAWDAGRD